MDEELQSRFTVRFEGSEIEVLYHVWRGQVDRVHLYFSAASRELVDGIDVASQEFARDETG